MRYIVATVLLSLSSMQLGHADEKKAVPIDAAKLVAKWELEKTTADSLPKGTIVEFTKDTMVLTIELNGKQHELKGKYTVQGDKLRVTLRIGETEGKEQIDTIKALTDDKLILAVDKGELEFVKKK